MQLDSYIYLYPVYYKISHCKSLYNGKKTYTEVQLLILLPKYKISIIIK